MGLFEQRTAEALEDPEVREGWREARLELLAYGPVVHTELDKLCDELGKGDGAA